MHTHTQVSAGGVAYRIREGQREVVLISVGALERWQLPKGRVDPGESMEATALREVREEAGIQTELVAPLDQIEYWFYTGGSGERNRVHKFVYFYLLRYLSGEPGDHDQEVNEARWVEIDQAYEMLAFPSEKQVLHKAIERLR
ncbi:MAG TPA: NUDIX hydrolase [Anaerolineales bacterium]